MERYKCSENRNQINMPPMCLDDMLPEDAEVRAIDAILGKMDIASMEFTYSELKETGGKPYSLVSGSKFRASNRRFAYHSEKNIQK